MSKTKKLQLDYATYRKLLEFIKTNGRGFEPFILLKNDLYKLYGVDLGRLLYSRFFHHKDILGKIVRDYGKMLDILCGLSQFKEDAEDITNEIIEFISLLVKTEPNFLEYNSRLLKTLEDYSKFFKQLEYNSKLLEQLKVGSIILVHRPGEFATKRHRTEVYRDELGNITDVIKVYSDEKIFYVVRDTETNGKINLYEEYRHGFGYSPHPNWVLIAENYANGQQFRYMYLDGFDFNAEELPTEEELSSFMEPKTLILYKKELAEQNAHPLPF